MESIFSIIFAFLVEAIILLQYASRLFSPKRPLSDRLVVLSLLYTCLCAVAFFNIKWLNMLWYLFTNFLFLVTQYDVKWRAAAFHSTLLAAVMGMCELIVYSIIARTAPHFYMQMSSFHNTLLFILCSKISFFAVIYLITHLFKSRQKTTVPFDSSVLLLMIIPVTSIFIMLTFVGMGDQYTLTPGTNRMISLSAFFLLLMNLLVFGINQYNREKNRKYTEVQLLLQKETDFTEYYKMLLSQSEKVNAYINELLLSSDFKESARICDNELLNAIMARYRRQCTEQGISFTADIRSGVLHFLPDSDLTSLFCNLLDNAMEAAGKVPDAYIEVNGSKRENTPFVLITVVNSCRVNPFKNDAADPATTKADKRSHGFGLKSIRKICEKYHGDIQMYYNDATLTFHTVITLRG